MKIKLLKKIRKRYSWWFNDVGSLLYIDHKIKEVHVVNSSWVKKYAPIHNFEENEFWQIFQRWILYQYGYRFQKRIYRKAKRIYEVRSKLNKLFKH